MNGTDTFVNGAYWKKVTSREHRVSYTTSLTNACQLPNVMSKVATSAEAFHALIREDNKVVYEQSISFPPLFDFNPGSGPTYMGDVWGSDTITVDGGLRRRFYTNWTYGGQTIVDTVIEGIGSLRRGLVPVIIDANAKLTCFESNGKIIYQNTDYPCSALFPKGTPTPVLEAQLNDKPSIYPNPFTDNFTISSLRGSARFSLYNSLGKLLIHEVVEGRRTISTSTLPPGIYIAVLRDDQGNTLHTERLMKH